MAYDARRDLLHAGGGDELPATALDYMLEQGDHEIVIDLLRGMLAKHGLSGAAIDTALEGECRKWLADQAQRWEDR